MEEEILEEAAEALLEEADAVLEEPTPNEWLERYQRTLAEFDNFRKRTLKEKAAAYDEGLRGAIEKLLPTLDNFERALAAAEDAEDPFFQGVSMIARQLEAYLEELGVTATPGAGAAFDPNLHFAVAHTEDPAYGAGEIMEVLQKGYQHKDRVLRPGMVKVVN